MNKTKLAVFCLLIIGVMTQMEIDADGGHGRRKQAAEQPAQAGAQATGQKRSHKGGGKGKGGHHKRGERKGGQRRGGQRKGCQGASCGMRRSAGATVSAVPAVTTATVVGGQPTTTATISAQTEITAPENPSVD